VLQRRQLFSAVLECSANKKILRSVSCNQLIFVHNKKSKYTLMSDRQRTR
jgi:hypothetical protein